MIYTYGIQAYVATKSYFLQFKDSSPSLQIFTFTFLTLSLFIFLSFSRVTLLQWWIQGWDGMSIPPTPTEKLSLSGLFCFGPTTERKEEENGLTKTLYGSTGALLIIESNK